MIAILDYDAGNIKSVEKAFKILGEETVLTRDFGVIEKADHVVLPGVGSFAAAMEHLKKYELDKAIKDYVQSGRPFLGICLGLQLLFDSSEESVGVEGLHLLDGEVVRIPDAPGIKVPHIGWNSLDYPNKGRLFDGIDQGSFVYFVHSYYLKASDPAIVTASTEYGCHIHASVEKDNIFACQFHPEKSSTVGLKILANFARL
ncbi:imidazole glycerol phosphate synthase subunit HisH [Pseudobutyrivibrio xylanivorans]|uniref:Imidazole glycerol phosphate synthase subunit HisH n=1 Tax=Pseudobutyrivibrio xylanivorans TaxID=185007 RepID=A0A5P6VSR7_PSEXY|nr:imidazole glycerol phosphate synthase subunit HisH [Pseudobutyrivibrio xylanivorans]QFJ55703.1 imidazole glycerol phosphate synthase subunit HisH [Pseudobutyrivibrio xylanivorans]